MNSLAAEERLSWLLAELRATGSVTLASAAERLSVSEMTVRRDMRALEKAGHARRVRGGAVSTGPVAFAGRDKSHSEAKLTIAGKLADLVPQRGLIAIDSSTTMYRLAAVLTAAQDLTVVTNSVETLTVLRDKPGITAVLTGGRFDPRSDSLVGPIAAACVSDLTFSTFFASAASLGDDGMCFEDTLEEAEVKRLMARSAERVVVGADTDKLGRRSVAASIHPDAISILCTELAPDSAALTPYRAAGLSIL